MTQENVQTVNFKAKLLKLSDLSIGDVLRPLSQAAFSNYVRALLLNWRQGTVACKDRSEVSYSRKKPWKQKGTGRARVGSARSPLWRKGGIIFGPQKRTRTTSITAGTKLAVKSGLLHELLRNDGLYCLDWVVEKNIPQASLAAKALKEVGFDDKKVILFLSHDDFLSQASWRNLPQVNIVLFDAPNALNLSYGDRWVVLKKDLNKFKEMVSSWH